MAREMTEEDHIAFTGVLTMPAAGETITERCLAPVRWETIIGYGHKLQQLWEVITERDDQPTERREEWRDVPYV